MDPLQEDSQSNEKQDNLLSYFTNKVFIGSVMFTIGVLLAMTTSYLASKNNPDTFQTNSFAAKSILQNIPYPSLPAGCFYTKTGTEDVSVECSPQRMEGESEEIAPGVPPIPTIAVALPKLPDHCIYESTTNGMIVKCMEPDGGTVQPIPTTIVSMPSIPKNCQKETSTEKGVKIRCHIEDTQSDDPTSEVTVSLPTLPAGCTYHQLPQGGTSVTCSQNNEPDHFPPNNEIQVSTPVKEEQKNQPANMTLPPIVSQLMNSFTMLFNDIVNR